MPYIKEKDREQYDWVVEALADMLTASGVAGNLNYVLFKLIVEMRKREECLSYQQISRFLAELNECSHEIRRRILQPYEDEKIYGNGDVY